MKAASASLIFTPEIAVFMNGYDKRRTLSTGVHQDLKASILLLEDVERTVIISFDLCGIDQDMIERIACNSGYRPNQLFVCATHTHASINEFPLLLSFGQLSMRSPDEEIRNKLAKEIAYAIKQAEEDLEEVVLYSKVTQAVGLFANRNDSEGPVDRFLNTLYFQTQNGRYKGCIVHLNTHPTILDYHNTLLSPDFIGTMRCLMETQLNCPLTVINGACADVSTRFTRRESSIEECERVGQELYKKISDLNGSKKISGKVELHTMVYHAKTCRYMPELEMKLSILVLGDLLLFGFPGEISVRFSREIRQIFDEQRVLICGYTNDYLGYFIDTKDPKDTYEANICTLMPEESIDFVDWLKSTLTFL